MSAGGGIVFVVIVLTSERRRAIFHPANIYMRKMGTGSARPSDACARFSPLWE